VPGAVKISRVIAFACVTGLAIPATCTVHVNVALLPSANVNVAVPT